MSWDVHHRKNVDREKQEMEMKMRTTYEKVMGITKWKAKKYSSREKDLVQYVSYNNGLVQYRSEMQESK